MASLVTFFGLLISLSCCLVATASPLDSAVSVRTPPGILENEVVQSIQRELRKAALQKRDQSWSNGTSFDRSWDNAILLRLGDAQTGTDGNNDTIVNIACTTCYITGSATWGLTLQSGFNLTEALETAKSDFETITSNLTTDVHDFLDDVLKDIGTIADGILDDDLSAAMDKVLTAALQPWANVSYDLSGLLAIPQAELSFSFDGFELYMLLDTALGGEATYTLPLFTSESLLGMQLTDDLGLGVYFEMALILDAEDEMDISSGFHLKVEDGLAIQIPLFSQNVTNITLNGGQSEFLPVTINGAASSFSAILQVGIHAGFDIADDSWDHLGIDIGYAAGIDVGVFANVAEFATNLTTQDNSDGCQTQLAQDYTLALGAAAGLTLTVDTHRWGPTPATTIPVYFTSLPTSCVSSGSTPTTPTTTITSTSGAEKRQNLATTTITTAVTYTGVSCESRGLINCPPSLQSTSTSTSSTTFVTALASGESLTLPIGVQTTVPSTVDFGHLAVTFGSTSGSPVSYNPSSTFNVPGAASSALHKIESGLNGDIHGVSKKLIFGLVFGFGMLLIILLAVGICLCCRKRKQERNNPASVVILERDNGGNKHRFFNRRENKGGMSVVQN